MHGAPFSIEKLVSPLRCAVRHLKFEGKPRWAVLSSSLDNKEREKETVALKQKVTVCDLSSLWPFDRPIGPGVGSSARHM